MNIEQEVITNNWTYIQSDGLVRFMLVVEIQQSVDMWISLWTSRQVARSVGGQG